MYHLTFIKNWEYEYTRWISPLLIDLPTSFLLESWLLPFHLWSPVINFEWRITLIKNGWQNQNKHTGVVLPGKTQCRSVDWLQVTSVLRSRSYKHPVRGRVVVLNCQQSRYADWWIWINVHTSNAFGWDFCTGHVEKAGLATSGPLFLRNVGRIELSFRWGMDTYLGGSGAGNFEVKN